ncbi:MAG: NACHT domain-containing protein, partial [Chlamydiales bacterium]
YVYTAKDILQREYSSLGVDFQTLLEDSTFLQNSLLILEGYDELPDDARIETRHLAHAFMELKAKFPHILMTSRPGSVEFNSNAEFEILGFNNEQISRYISQYFDQMVKTGRLDAHEKQRKIELLKQLMVRQPLVHSLAHIPINLTILCSILHANEEQFKGEVPLTITALYSQIIGQFYKIFLLRKGRSKDEVRQFTKPGLDPSITHIAKVLEEVAIYAMKQGTLYISQEWLGRMISPRGIGLGLIKDLGLFKIEGKRGQFIHLTFQEYFAAVYLARLYLEGNHAQARQLVATHKFMPRFKNTLRMTAGYLSNEASEDEENKGALIAFFQDLRSTPNDKGVTNALHMAAQCFEEYDDSHGIMQHQHFIATCKQFIENAPHESMIFDLLNCNSKLLQHNEIRTVFISLLQKRTSEMTSILSELASNRQVLPHEIIQSLMAAVENFAGDGNGPPSWLVEEVAVFFGNVAKGGNDVPKEAVEWLLQMINKREEWRDGPSIDAFVAILKRQVENSSQEDLLEMIRRPPSPHEALVHCVIKALGELIHESNVHAEHAKNVLFEVFLDLELDHTIRILPLLAITERISQIDETLLLSIEDKLISIAEDDPVTDLFANLVALSQLRIISIARGRVSENFLNTISTIVLDEHWDFSCRKHSVDILVRILSAKLENVDRAKQLAFQLVKHQNIDDRLKKMILDELFPPFRGKNRAAEENLFEVRKRRLEESGLSYSRTMGVEVQGVGEESLELEICLRKLGVKELFLEDKFLKKASLSTSKRLSQPKRQMIKTALELGSACSLKISEDRLTEILHFLLDKCKDRYCSIEMNRTIVSVFPIIILRNREIISIPETVLSHLINLVKNHHVIPNQNLVFALMTCVGKVEKISTENLRDLFDWGFDFPQYRIPVFEEIKSQILLGVIADELTCNLVITICYLTKRSFVVDDGMISISDNHQRIPIPTGINVDRLGSIYAQSISEERSLSLPIYSSSNAEIE